jgi:beta-galactosidase
MNKGQVAASNELRTAGSPAQLRLVVDKKSLGNWWDEVAFVNASVLDDQGTVVPNAENLINFKVEGAGFVAAVDSANSNSHEPYQASQRQAFQGICLALIKANANRGKIKVTATSTNLRSASVELSISQPIGRR